MHLYEFAVGVKASLLVKRGLRGASADHRVGRLAKDCTDATGGHDQSIAGEGADFHGAQVHGAYATTGLVVVEDCAQEFPVLVFLDATFRFVTPDLLIKRIEKLLAGGGAGKSRAMVQRAAEATKIEQAFRRAIEGNAHAVEQVNDGGRSLTHGLHRRLVGQEVTAVNGVVKVLPCGVAFALQVFRGVDTALCADRV